MELPSGLLASATLHPDSEGSPRAKTEFDEYSSKVVLDGSFRQHESAGDGGVAESLGDQLGHIALARCQHGVAGGIRDQRRYGILDAVHPQSLSELARVLGVVATVPRSRGLERGQLGQYPRFRREGMHQLGGAERGEQVFAGGLTVAKI